MKLQVAYNLTYLKMTYFRSTLLLKDLRVAALMAVQRMEVFAQC